MMCTGNKQDEDVAALRRHGGNRLRLLRMKAGLSQRELANVLDLDYYTVISQIETGRGRIPPDRYEDWARVLKIDPAEFVRLLLRYYDPVTHRLLFEPTALAP
jgi:transcriptional regulator with XRE-family HTH domain